MRTPRQTAPLPRRLGRILRLPRIPAIPLILLILMIPLVGPPGPLGPESAAALSIGEERRLGQKLLYSLRRELEVLDDPDISRYINDLGGQVLKVAGPTHFDYRFFVVKSEQFNAFAAPAGLVFFYSGLIEAMRGENELVSVLAHEIGHVQSRHIADRLEKNTRVGLLSTLLGVAGLALGVPGLSEGILTGSLAAGQTAALKYSRDDEEQSDRLAFGWMRAMGRDPEGMRDMLRTMRRVTRYRANNVPQYLLTHPDPEARVGYVDSLIELAEKREPGRAWRKIDNFPFLRFRYRVLARSMDLNRLRQACLAALGKRGDGGDAAAATEEDAMAHFGLALIETENRRFDLALDHMAKVQARFPERPILKTDEAVILIGAGRYAEARTILEGQRKRDPEDMYSLFHLARTEAALGDTARAGVLFKQAERRLPEYPALHFELAQIEARRGEEGRSVFHLGKYHLYQGQEKLARQSLERAGRDKNLPEGMRAEAKEILADLDKLKKGE